MFSLYRVGFSPTTRRMRLAMPGVQPRDSNCDRGMRIAAEAIAISITLQEGRMQKGGGVGVRDSHNYYVRPTS